jgi:biofilm PGA synthesis N-glycosyltransferase PgaC
MAFSTLAALLLVCYFIFLYCAIYWIVVLFERSGREHKRARKFSTWPAVTIIIPAYNAARTIARSVSSCLSLDYPREKLRIVVIDDGSTDKTLSALAPFRRKISVIRRKRNGGKAAALNQAIKQVKTPFVCCLDADSFFSPGSLKALVGEFTEETGAVASSMKVDSPRSPLERIQRLEYFFSIYLRELMTRLDALYVVPGPGSVYRTSVLRKVGGFDEDNLTEDMDIAFRIKEAGWGISSSPDGESTTLAPSSLSGLTRQRMRWYAGYFQNVEKHRKFLFNPKFAELGLFILPVNFVLILAMTLILFVAVADLAQAGGNLARDFFLVSFSLFTPSPIRLEEVFYSFNTLNVFFLIFSVLACFVIYASFKMSREAILGKNDNLWDFILYTIFYFPLVSVFYLISVVYYLASKGRKGVRLKWQGKNLKYQDTS